MAETLKRALRRAEFSFLCRFISPRAREELSICMQTRRSRRTWHEIHPRMPILILGEYR